MIIIDFFSLHPNSQTQKNWHLPEIMTGKKQVFIGFPLNFTGLNMMEKQKNRF